ncbi:MAG: hypothetical protein M5U28_20185 [Sandaracinaceae bacterium]|nr:hypothetical protein [Sandaracinaceae bacterium]
MASYIASSALAPWRGSLECPLLPVSSSRSMAQPLCMRTGKRPVGSPMMARRARGLPAATSARAPSIPVSSSAVANRTSGSRRSAASNERAASMASARNAFMSEVPSP